MKESLPEIKNNSAKKMLWKVERTSNGIVRVAELSSEQYQEIIQAHADDGMIYEKALANRGRDLLHAMKRAHYWLACGCLGEEDPPIMAICQRENVLYLRRNPTSPLHASQCFFFSLPTETVAVEETRTAPKKSAYFGIYHQVTRVSKPQDDSSKPDRLATNAVRLPRLARSFFRLLEAAGWQTIDRQKNFRHQYPDLTEAAKRLLIAPGIKLSEFLWTYPHQLTLAQAKLTEAQCLWPSPSTPQGFMLIIADKVEGQQLVGEINKQSFTLKLHGKIRFVNGRVENKSPPYLAFISIVCPPGKQEFMLTDAFVVPVLSKEKLHAIESGFERQVLKKLLSVRSYLEEKCGENVILEKPLFDIPVSGRKSCRPDFIMRRASGKSVVIEVMGSHEEDYTQRKARTHRLMRQIGQVKEFDALTAHQTGDWDTPFRLLAKRIYGALLGEEKA